MTKISPPRTRSTLLTALGFAAALASCLVAAPATAQSVPSTARVVNSEFETSTITGCADLHACLFGGANYTSTEVVLSAADDPGHWLLPINGLSYRSAKNNFDNRRLQIGHMRADGSIEVIRCLNPNTQRPGPFPDGGELVRVGILGSRCAS